MGRSAAEMSAHQTDLPGKGFKQTIRRQVAGNDDDFGEPCRHPRAMFSSRLDFNAGIGYHKQRDLLVRK